VRLPDIIDGFDHASEPVSNDTPAAGSAGKVLLPAELYSLLPDVLYVGEPDEMRHRLSLGIRPQVFGALINAGELHPSDPVRGGLRHLPL